MDEVSELVYSYSIALVLHSNLYQVFTHSMRLVSHDISLHFRRLLDEDDDALNEVGPDAVPSEVRDWLAQTFTKSSSRARVRGDRPKFKSVAQAIRAGIMVDR